MNPTTPDPDDDDLARALHASRGLQDAPEALIQRVIDQFEARPRRAPRALLPRLLAVLQFDSGTASPLAHGMRGSSSDMRQLLFALPDCDVDLRVAPDDDGRCALSGQLLGPACQGVVFAQPEAGGDDVPDVSAALNELGEFRLPPLPAGAWRLTFELADRTLELPLLHLATDAGARDTHA